MNIKIAPVDGGFVFFQEVPCGGWATTMQSFVVTDPFSNPGQNYKCYIKKVWFELSSKGPAPTTTTYIVGVQGGNPNLANTPLIAAITDTATASAAQFPALTNPNTMLTRTPGTGNPITVTVTPSAAPGNAASSPYLGFGVEFGLLYTY